MKKSRFTDSQIIAILKQHEAEMAPTTKLQFFQTIGSRFGFTAIIQEN